MDLDDEGDFVDMVEGNLEEDMELVQEENIRRRANAQEQVKGGDRERRMGERSNCVTSIEERWEGRWKGGVEWEIKLWWCHLVYHSA